MKNIRVKIKGVTAMLQHRMPEDELFSLLGTKTKKKQDKEELLPREIADKYAYKTEEGNYFIPAEFISGAMAYVASEYKQKNSARKSMKGIIKGVVTPCEAQIDLFNDEKCKNKIMKFEVDVRKATNHQKGAVAVCRPRFDKWYAEFSLDVDTDLISSEMVKEILEDAGKRSGIGSFRVSKGGTFGKFQVIEFNEDKK